jgi:hypothetical protein
MADARFADAAGDRPLRLLAETPDDLPVIAALVQDGVGRVGDAAFLRRKRRFVAVLNRFRWEDKAAAERARRPYERVRAALTVEGVLSAKARGVTRGDADAVYNLLDMAFQPGEDAAGVLLLTLSGGGEIALAVEALDVALADISKPWTTDAAPAHDAPGGA